MLRSTILCDTFCQRTQVYGITQPWDLDMFIYYSSQFLDFISLNSKLFYFLLAFKPRTKNQFNASSLTPAGILIC